MQSNSAPPEEPIGRGRVAVVLHEPVLGGATQSVLRLVPALEQRGWTFSFWLPRPSAAYDELIARGWDADGAPRFVEHSIRAWRLPPGPRRRAASIPSYFRAFRGFLRSRKPDLVHANAIITISEALAAKREGHRVLLHAHEMLPPGLRGRALRRAAWRRLDEVAAVSKASGARLAWKGHAPRIVYEAAPVPDEHVRLRENPNPFTVGTVAVVSTRKGSDLFVEAARRLLADGHELAFEMIGAANDAIEREWAHELLSRAQSLGIQHQPEADVWSRFRDWDAFILPSRADPFPISMLEAMASGLPVIGTAVDGIAEQVTPECGYLVPPEDAGALAEAILRLSRLELDRRAEMGATGRRRVQDSFTLAHQADALESAYRSALAAPGAGPPAPSAAGRGGA